MPKRRGGQISDKARKGTAEPDAEHSGSEDEPMGEPPLVMPCTRLVEAEAQTHWYVNDKVTQTPADKVWAAVRSIPGYTPRKEKDGVMLTRAALEEHKVVLSAPCAKQAR